MTLSIRKMLAAVLSLGILGLGTAPAQNSIPYAESFESWTNFSIINTNANWYSPASDLSCITNWDITSLLPANCTAPLNSSTHYNVLKLNTEDGVLTNNFGGADISDQTIYLDTLIQFVPSETTPTTLTSGSGIKAAVYMDVSSNLVIYHGIVSTLDGSLSGSTNETTTAKINPTNWYRLTIAFDASYTVSHGWVPDLEMFQVRTNGIAVQNPNAYNDNWKDLWEAIPDTGFVPETSPTGTWFRSAVPSGGSSRNLQSLCFQGTGYLDDLVVSTVTPTYSLSGPSSYTITVVTGSGGNSSTGGVNLATALASFTIASGGSTSIVYTANDWYRINSLNKDGTPVGAAANARAYTQDLVNVTADISNNVSFAQVNPGVVNTGLTNIPASWLTNWSEGTPYDNSPLTAYELYLLNANPFVAQTNNFRVTGVSVTGGTNVAVTVGLQLNSVNHTNINGYLKLTGKTNLAETSWTQVAQATALTGEVFTNSGTYTYSFVDTVSNRFYKAVIEETP